MTRVATRTPGPEASRLRAALLGGIGAFAVGTVGIVMLLWGETMLIASIVFAVKTLGLWPACLVFYLGWTVMGLASLAIYDRAWPILHPILIRWWRELWPSRKGAAHHKNASKRVEPSFITRLVLATARVSRPLGVLAAAALVGGPGTPVWRLLGFQRASGYVAVVLSSALFTLCWVPAYGIGGVGLWDLIAEAV